ncbi:HAD-IIB family hydrolase [Candidatus Enterococcus willemsii]|uniref:Hydrolase n=1 Tax=Candidatus Enterococcus willemsii TaxID=1857215 RepID=A0ABQ6YZA6_9ENTE|nr:HAD-IIB family hydrolase [Enterococcus sp. CU12B]KAF1303789.1 hypothetical protein BAU17_11440 [Enterococcus sp. CU12B]
MNYVFDVDGTICFNGQFIEQEILSILKKLNNSEHQLLFASARPIRDLLPVIPDFLENTLIGGNGAVVSIGSKVQVISKINAESYAQILQLITEYQLDYIIDDQWNYAAKVAKNNPIFKQLDPAILAKKIPFEQIQTPIKIILLNVPQHLYSEIYQQLSHQELAIITHNHEGNIDITAKNINKWTTLKEIIGKEEYVAFGNDSNDTQLLQNAKRSFFVGNEQQAKKLGIQNTEIISPSISTLAKILQAEIEQ